MVRARRGFRPARRPLAIVMATSAVLLTACGSATTEAGTATGAGSAGHFTRTGRAGHGTKAGDVSSHPARDSFTGTVRSAAGKYSGATGRVHVYLRPQGHGVSRPVTLTLASTSCRAAANCLELSGRLAGALTPAPGHLPDTGHGYLLNATGMVSPLGSVRARGSVHGTGFIPRGEETLDLTLTGSTASIVIDALSAPVRGFTSP